MGTTETAAVMSSSWGKGGEGEELLSMEAEGGMPRAEGIDSYLIQKLKKVPSCCLGLVCPCWQGRSWEWWCNHSCRACQCSCTPVYKIIYLPILKRHLAQCRMSFCFCSPAPFLL